MPANLATKCPGCGAGYRLKDASAAGKKMKCRRCEQIFVIKPAGSRQAEPRPEPDDFGSFDESDFDDFGPAAGPHDQELLSSPGRSPAGKTKSKSKSRKAGGKKKPRKKSKRRKDSGGISPVTIAGGGIVLVVLLVGALLLLKPGGAEGIKPPASYEKFQHPINNLFTCEYPSDWEAKHGGQPGSVIWAQFETGKAKIEIRQGASGGALGDIFGAASPNPDAPEDETPVARVHRNALMKDPVADNFDDYSEQEAHTMKTGMGDARISQFSASGRWGKKISGYRATLLGGGGKQLRVVASCPDGDWEVCSKVFERMIASIR